MPDQSLVADCARCVGLCCVALPFTRSADFAFSKPAGDPCRNLADDDRCRVHATLADRGMHGCLAFDCFGAGQKVTQVTFGGRSWRDGGSGPMFAAFAVMRQLHELLVHVDQALELREAAPVHADLRSLRDEIDAETRRPDVVDIDPAALRARVGPLLAAASALARAGLPGAPHRGADLVGARLRRADLRGADLRGALLLGADLREADLRRADLLGADLRGADLRGADLTGALFVVGPQLAAART
ncbi:pentapeptide repeat-containing protein [Cellulomonas edaphi]|uniref:Pentapeptide repeat-containing protein n=1 Tax=Cellulomonas edaphi TaxID=3053468 RepID=A0ABT7SAA7_9CELL|nr:pentapeptide repeat-containing protein [Cellulomons edaphi]MDM7832559.1 pentapeptide repeat-containing protein [Cellulomons edaphi]